MAIFRDNIFHYDAHSLRMIHDLHARSIVLFAERKRSTGNSLYLQGDAISRAIAQIHLNTFRRLQKWTIATSMSSNYLYLQSRIVVAWIHSGYIQKIAEMKFRASRPTCNYAFNYARPTINTAQRAAIHKRVCELKLD